MEFPMTIADINDADSHALLQMIVRIMQLSEKDTAEAVGGNSFNIYKTARDARDLMTFDAVSRDVLRKMGAGNGDMMHKGVVITANVLDHIKCGRKINAIKELRDYTGFGLKESKDLVESVMEQCQPF